MALRRAADHVQSSLLRRVPAADGGVRLSFTFPDVDPETVPVGDWEPYRELDGEHRMWAQVFQERRYGLTRLRLAESGPGFCHRWGYGPTRRSYNEQVRALLHGAQDSLVLGS